MTNLALTCDRLDDLIRVAVWHGTQLRDLYLDSTINPDMTGAIIGGKVVRVNPAQKTAYIDFGNMGFLPNAAHVKAGQLITARIASPASGDKAAVCQPCVWNGDLTTGLLQPPPKPWQRALVDLKNIKPTAITFSHPHDLTACRSEMERTASPLLSALQPLRKTSPHPDLSETLDDLCESTVVLPCGGSLILERTAALIALDVNAGEAKNPLTVNLHAVREAARQLRLRQWGGQFMIDCLRMPHRTDQAKVLHAIKTDLATDPAGAQALGFTKLGLLEGLRTRRGPTVEDLWLKKP